jgi:methionine synthase I (cobalamin-dependent)/5,10-methylenetetrahydrofolate reductase
MPLSFTDRLSRGFILCDGAMGTQLYARGGHLFDQSLDAVNLTEPDLVKSIHLAYLSNGSELIATNTFGANSVRLAAYGMADRMEEINRAGVVIAHEARRLTGQNLWIAGTIGPAGRAGHGFGPLMTASAYDAFYEQAKVLADAGVDLVVFETFGDIPELEEAIKAVQSATDLPVVAQMTFAEEGRTLGGESPEAVVAAMERLNVTALGANCSVGPASLLQVVERMAAVAHTPLIAQPNAGLPTYRDGRLVYVSSPEYMAGQSRLMIEAGVALIGGCCGTTPEHLAAVRDAAKNVRPQVRTVSSQTVTAPTPEQAAPSWPVPPSKPTGLAQRLQRGEFVVTVEVDPPRGFDISTTLERLRGIAGSLHAINVADSPRAQGRMSALATASLIQSKLGIETIMHMAIRHRNLVALHSDLLGAHALGVRNMFVVMGDVPVTGDYPNATAVTDVTAAGLVELISKFNSGVDNAGRAIDQPTSFVIGAAFNFSAANMDRELRVLDRKVKAGANFLLTQPVYDPEQVEKVWQRIGGFPAPVIMGVLPLRSERHAQFLHNEVPGIIVPDQAFQRIGAKGADPAAEGIALSQELINAVHQHIAGVYFIPPFGRYQVVEETMSGVDVPGLASSEKR